MNACGGSFDTRSKGSGGRVDEAEVLKAWRRSLMILHRAHWEAAGYFEDRNFWIGLTAAAMSAIAGTTVFATLEQDSPSVIVRVAIGVFSVIATMLAAIQAFLRSAASAERHKAAGIKFGQLRRELDQALIVGLPADAAARETALNDFRKRWDEVESNVPPVPSAIFKRVSRNVARYGTAEIDAQRVNSYSGGSAAPRCTVEAGGPTDLKKAV